MMRPAPFILSVVILLPLVANAGAFPSPAQADGPAQVGLVVKFSDSREETFCIQLDEPQATGCDILDASGLTVAYKDYGGQEGLAVCGIDDVGCDPSGGQSCFCECEGADCQYWAYYHLDPEGGEWEYSTAGCSGHMVHHGDVEGWAWGPGAFGQSSDVKPTLISFEELCATPTNTPEPSPPVVSFVTEPEIVAAGQCSVLKWDVQNAQVAALDGEGVRLHDARQVCPPQTQSYQLVVVNAAGEFEYWVTVHVTQPTATPPSTSTSTPRPRPTSTSTDVPSAQGATPTTQPSPTPLSPSPTGTPTPTVSPTTMVAMIADPAVPAAQEVSESTSDVTPPAPSSQEGVTVGRVLLLLGTIGGTLGFGGLAFLSTILALVIIYLRARALMARDYHTER